MKAQLFHTLSYYNLLVQPEPAAAASCYTVPQATAGTLFTFCLVYFQNRTEYARTYAVT